MEKHIGRKFRLSRKIGKGSFGEIFQGVNMETNESVAIKLESKSINHPQLQYEARIYRILEGIQGIPSIYWYGTEGDHNIMVMDLLGPSLEDLNHLCNRKMSMKSVLMLADQLLSLLEAIHEKNFIHRDIKPENFLIGLGSKAGAVFAIDFGLAKRYRDGKTNQHIPFRDGKNLTGTARYVSIYTHMGYEQSRRDDLEGLAYMLIYLVQGKLPWQGASGATKEQKYRQIFLKKSSTSAEDLCSGLPIEFKNFLNYSKSIKFEDNPDYPSIRNSFKDAFERENFSYDSIFDWTRLTVRKDSLNFEDYNKPIKKENSDKEECKEL
ncbi:hypothetical protein SteCoe_19249 [Stentor coeruleus]|uniref:Casein kinase I n=1 Tax=Stentor coeruleus TaxID=5963 RepID=A0A1R2BUJ5_9CILI|nr:hypothetical protein SteCoe_19249 [Stentor coeruleus]